MGYFSQARPSSTTTSPGNSSGRESPMRFEPKLAAGVTIAIALLIGGCRSSTVQEPLASRARHNNPQPQVEFWHALAERPLVSNDEAFHALLLCFDGQDDANGYEQR